MTEKMDKLKQSGQTKHIPKDAQVIMSIMRDMDISEYEPRVINQLLEFIYRYVACILEDAKAYANHAKKKSIDLDDVKLALSIQLEQVFTNPPPREVLAEVARTKNNTPLPFIKPHCGVRLPPDRYCLSSSNLRLKSPQFTKKNNKVTTTFGSAMGDRNIKMTTKPGLGVLRRTLSTVSKTQTVTIPKSVPKLTPQPQFKTTVKPKTQIVTTPNAQLTVPSAILSEDDLNPLKRKRDEDDYDVGPM